MILRAGTPIIAHAMMGLGQLRAADDGTPAHQTFLPVGRIDAVNGNGVPFAGSMDEPVVADIYADVGDEDASGSEEYQIARLQAADINRGTEPVLLIAVARNVQAELLITVLHQPAAIEACLRPGAAECIR